MDVDYRAGSAICTKDATVLVLSKEDYQKFILKIKLKQQADLNVFLKTLPYFRTWPTKWLNKLQYYLEEIKFIRNQPVFLEGEESNDVYLV